MHHKRLKSIGRAFNNHFIAFNQANHIYSSVGMVFHFFGEPMSAGFNKFAFVQAGTFFHPAIAFSNFLNID